ncbi:MAG: hypothetical protein IJ597_00965, partial [Synergistaceae bacterium]|nr:hypothetical protein [Synergistaceae bacterium]
MSKKPEGNGFAELLRYSHMVAPEVMALKDGGLLGGFWLAGPDLESSTARELEHLGAMMSHTISQLDVRWCVHFEFFRREVRDYPKGDFTETTTKLIDLERDEQFHKQSGHFESVQAMFVTYTPPAFEKNKFVQKVRKFFFGIIQEDEDELIDRQLARFEAVMKHLYDSLSLSMKVRRMTFHPDINDYRGTSELLES